MTAPTCARSPAPSRRAFNRRVQLIFQDPYSSLNPRMTVRETLAEALRVHRLRPPAAIPDRIAELMGLVRLPRDALDRYPHEFSGAPPSLAELPPGCAFAPRCAYATDACRQGRPALVAVGPDHQSACLHHDRVARSGRAG